MFAPPGFRIQKFMAKNNNNNKNKNKNKLMHLKKKKTLIYELYMRTIVLIFNTQYIESNIIHFNFHCVYDPYILCCMFIFIFQGNFLSIQTHIQKIARDE